MVAFNNSYTRAALANQNYLNSIAAAEHQSGIPIGQERLHAPLQGEVPNTFSAMPNVGIVDSQLGNHMVGFVGVVDDLHAHANGLLLA